ncbi:MAG: poly-gamma-glutamate synthase PgsB [Oscillospiraceae bacterium]|nr:poly-gamma-glutamate synthase PgsB [Oscillospiraceae bacterium]
MLSWQFYLIVVVLIGIAVGLLLLEKRRNERNLKKLKIRVNVNGIRGKSTITRLITRILQEAGYHVVGKTTGTAARMIYWDREEEEEIVRKPRGVSISEQIRVINKAAKAGADALVCECMAVRPDYQKVFQHDILKGGIVVIVNVLEDHLDEMGPTLDQLAWAFGDTIPYHGIAVVPDCEYTEYFRAIAEDRGSKLVVAKPGILPEGYLEKFDYKIFENNCVMALNVARALGIPDDVSFRGMLRAHPDPGALRIEEVRNKNLHSWLINAFAANEPASTLEIWEYLKDMDLPKEDPIVVMNCRPDRVDRSMQFARDCLSLMGPIRLFVIGEKAEPIDHAYQRGKLPNVTEYRNLSNRTVRQIMNELTPLLDEHILFCIGNIHGIGEEFLEAVRALNPRSLLGSSDNRSDLTKLGQSANSGAVEDAVSVRNS